MYTAIEWLGLFRLARIFRFGRQPITSWLSDNHWLRVPLLVFLFVLLAHWLGLIWYAIAIWPLHYDPSAMNLTTAQLSDYPQYNGAAVAAAASGKAGDLGADAIQQLPWVWLSDEDPQRALAIRYICSLYWALTVMTNLKGIATHETRQCLWHDPLVTQPFLERFFTVCTFVLGAVFFSVIYGNIAQFIQVRASKA